MFVATVSSKGWVVIPAEIRKKYHLHPGSQVRVVDYGGVLSILPAQTDPVNSGKGLLKGKTSLLKSLQGERIREKKREKRKKTNIHP